MQAPRKSRLASMPDSKMEKLIRKGRKSEMGFDADAESGDENRREGVRRSDRTRTPNHKYNGLVFNDRRGDRREESSDTDDDDNEEYEAPTTLFNENEDVEGGKLFQFKTPKKRNGMEQLAANTPKTPKLSAAIHGMSLDSPGTPSSSGRALSIVKTPHQERDKFKKGKRFELMAIGYKYILYK